MQLDRLSEIVLAEATRRGASDASVIASKVEEEMIRFSDNSITVSKKIHAVVIEVYLAKDKRRVVGVTSNPKEESIMSFVKKLVESCLTLPESPDYTPLPKAPSKYSCSSENGIDILEDGTKLVEYARESIDASLSEGATRVSGSIRMTAAEIAIMTSGGAQGTDKRGNILLNVRAFTSSGSSGHGLSCASNSKDFDPKAAGETAGKDAKAAERPRPCEEGIYDVIFTSTVAADIFQHVGSAASAFTVDAGASFLTGKVGQKVAAENLTLKDVGVGRGTLGGRIFDDEGVMTQESFIVKKGVLTGYLHNTTTARKFNASSTGNAGILSPHPWNLMVDSGDMELDEMVRQVRKGILVTNNWYTRFQNLRNGEYSTIPRDAIFLIENGKIKHPITGLRISDSIPRQLENIHALTKERKWIEWWEVNTPTFTPSLLVNGVQITRAIE